jgi:pilin isopeptide linkage protein
MTHLILVFTYYISEKIESKPFIEYTSSTVKVQVTVTDAGDGKLATDVQYVAGTLDDNGHALFTNKSTLSVPTGIVLEILPYALIVVVAVSLGVLMIVCRRKRKI